MTDEEMLTHGRELVLEMYENVQRLIEEGKSPDDVAADLYPQGEEAELVVEPDVRELGRADAPNGTRIWVYRHVHLDRCYLLGVARRTALRQQGCCLLTAYVSGGED